MRERSTEGVYEILSYWLLSFLISVGSNMELDWTDPRILWTVFLTLVLVFLYYWYRNLPYAYWEKRGVLHEPGSSSIGLILLLLKKDVLDIEKERYSKYGRIHGIFEGKDPILSVADPDLVRNILVKDFQVFPTRRKFESGNDIFDNMITSLDGEDWKRIRSVISPTFSTGKIKRMTDIIVSSAETLAKVFASEAGKPVNVKKFFETFTMDVIASVAFGTKIHSHADPNNRFLLAAKKMFPSKMPWRFFLFFIFPLKLLTLLGLDMFNTDVINFFKEETVKIIEDRKTTGKTRNDFLQLLMEVEKETREAENKKAKAQDDDDVKRTVDDENAEELGHEENNDQIFKLQKSSKSLSQDELISQCVLFFLSGYLTTSHTLSFIAYLLAIHPEIQDKLRVEIDSVIQKHDGKLTYAGIQEMEYLDKVISETLRLYPPIIKIERIASENYELGDTGIVIEKGKMVAIPVFSMHRDPEHYPEPEEFKPERFTKEGKATRHPYSFLAFGAGPRNCVAMRFALMEIKLCITYLVSQFLIKRCPETKVPLEIFAGLGILDPKEVMLVFEKRENRIFDGLQEI